MRDQYVILVFPKKGDALFDEEHPKGKAEFVTGLDDLLHTVHVLTQKGYEYRVNELGKCIADTVKLEKGDEQWEHKSLS